MKIKGMPGHRNLDRILFFGFKKNKEEMRQMKDNKGKKRSVYQSNVSIVKKKKRYKKKAKDVAGSNDL